MSVLWLTTLTLSEERMLRTKRHLCKFPFFQRLKEHSEVPLAFCMLGKSFMGCAEAPNDELRAFLMCLPHCITANQPAPTQQGGGALLPVDSRSQVPFFFSFLLFSYRPKCVPFFPPFGFSFLP